MELETLLGIVDLIALIGPILVGCLLFWVLAALVVWGLTRKRRPKHDTKPTRPIREQSKKPNPLLSALATICLLIVLYLIFFAPGANWPLAVLFALIGLVFGKAARL